MVVGEAARNLAWAWARAWAWGVGWARIGVTFWEEGASWWSLLLRLVRRDCGHAPVAHQHLRAVAATHREERSYLLRALTARDYLHALTLEVRLQRRRHLCSVLGFNEGVRRGLGGLAKHWAHDAGRAGSIELRL